MSNPVQRSYMMKGAADTFDFLPPGYLYVSILNNTAYTVQLFKDSGDKSLSARFAYVQPWTHATLPLPPGLQVYTVDWSGSTDEDKVTLIFSETNLGINQNFGGPTNQSEVQVINTPNVNVTDRANRQLGHVTVDGMPDVHIAAGETVEVSALPPVALAAGQSVDVTDRTGRDVGKVRLMDSGGVLIAGKQGHKETGAGVEEKTVKIGPGRVFSVVATVACTINDGTGNDVYFVPANVPVSFGLRPLECGTDIRVGFTGAGDCYLQFE